MCIKSAPSQYIQLQLHSYSSIPTHIYRNPPVLEHPLVVPPRTVLTRVRSLALTAARLPPASLKAGPLVTAICNPRSNYAVPPR